MSEILTPLVERLRRYSHAELELIAADAGIAKTLPRKLVCGDRTNPTVGTIEPLIKYLDEVDSGERALPFTPTKPTDKEGA